MPVSPRQPFSLMNYAKEGQSDINPFFANTDDGVKYLPLKSNLDLSNGKGKVEYTFRGSGGTHLLLPAGSYIPQIIGGDPYLLCWLSMSSEDQAGELIGAYNNLFYASFYNKDALTDTFHKCLKENVVGLIIPVKDYPLLAEISKVLAPLSLGFWLDTSNLQVIIEGSSELRSPDSYGSSYAKYLALKVLLDSLLDGFEDYVSTKRGKSTLRKQELEDALKDLDTDLGVWENRLGFPDLVEAAEEMLTLDSYGALIAQASGLAAMGSGKELSYRYVGDLPFSFDPQTSQFSDLKLPASVAADAAKGNSSGGRNSAPADPLAKAKVIGDAAKLVAAQIKELGLDFDNLPPSQKVNLVFSILGCQPCLGGESTLTVVTPRQITQPDVLLLADTSSNGNGKSKGSHLLEPSTIVSETTVPEVNSTVDNRVSSNISVEVEVEGLIDYLLEGVAEADSPGIRSQFIQCREVFGSQFIQLISNKESLENADPEDVRELLDQLDELAASNLYAQTEKWKNYLATTSSKVKVELSDRDWLIKYPPAKLGKFISTTLKVSSELPVG